MSTTNDKPKTKAIKKATVDGERYSVHLNGNYYELWSRSGKCWLMHGYVSHPDNIEEAIFSAQEEMQVMLSEWL